MSSVSKQYTSWLKSFCLCLLDKFCYFYLSIKRFNHYEFLKFWWHLPFLFFDDSTYFLPVYSSLVSCRLIHLYTECYIFLRLTTRDINPSSSHPGLLSSSIFYFSQYYYCWYLPSVEWETIIFYLGSSTKFYNFCHLNISLIQPTLFIRASNLTCARGFCCLLVGSLASGLVLVPFS